MTLDNLSAEHKFRKLYDDHHRSVLAYFLRRVDRSTARDCTEEVFLVGWRKLSQVPEGAGARPWLFGVARRVLLNQQRAARRRLRVIGKLASQPKAVAPASDSELLRHESQNEVMAAFTDLAFNDQEILRLAYWEELPHSTIGQILGCSTGAVDVRLHRAIKRLRKGIANTGHETSKGAAVLREEQGE